MEHMRFKTPKKYRSTTTMKEYPQVRKTGVDAVHEKLPRRSISRRNVICNVCVLMTEIYTIEGRQKDALLRKANV